MTPRISVYLVPFSGNLLLPPLYINRRQNNYKYIKQQQIIFIDQFMTNFDVLLTVHFSIFISVINQIDAQNFCFTISLFHASTCFEHMCSSSGGQKLLYTPTGVMIPETV